MTDYRVDEVFNSTRQASILNSVVNAKSCLGIFAKAFRKKLDIPRRDYIKRVVTQKYRRPYVLRNLGEFYQHDRLA